MEEGEHGLRLYESGANALDHPCEDDKAKIFRGRPHDGDAGDRNERIYGLGQGGWTKSGGCPSGAKTPSGAAAQVAVPLSRNGQTITLLQTKFDVAIPAAFSSAGYATLFNMPGYGSVTLGEVGVGGMHWNATAALYLDFWISGLPAKGGPSIQPLHSQYASVTVYAPPLREEDRGRRGRASLLCHRPLHEGVRGSASTRAVPRRQGSRRAARAPRIFSSILQR